jgi:Ca2+-binding RTX toxin-like protein
MVEDTPLVITVSDLLANDYDLDNQAISVTRIVDTHNVSVSFTAAGPGVSDPNNPITITPDLNVNGPAWFDYEITDSTGRTATARVNISIAAVNDPPAIGDIPAFVGFEGQAFSAALPAGLVTDVDNDPLLIDVQGPGGQALPGWLHFDRQTLAFSGTPPLGTFGAVPLVLTASDGIATTTKAFTITITHVNHAPSDATLTGGSVAENSADGTVVGTVTGADPDAGDTLSYALTNDAGGRFAIDTATGVVTVADGALLDFESATSHGITVRVTDQGGLFVDEDFTIAVTNVNEAPTDATMSGGTVAENSANGTAVGTVTGIDPDAGAVLSYALVDSAGGRFAIDSTSGAITVANGTLLDYEQSTSHTITVRVTDQGGLTFDKDFTIHLTNVPGITLTGTNAANTLIGTGEEDTLIGLGGADTLDGRGGPDTMIGGTGNDTYIVDDPGDVVIENPGEGTDTVKTSLATYTLPDNVENLIGTAATAQTLIGNALGNTITSGLGGGTLIGGAGNDVLTGAATDDTLIGGAGNDTLDGGAGADLMMGGLGNDTYIVDDPGDVVVENAGEGTDTVKTSLASYTLTDNVENLIGTAATAQVLIGNALGNTITSSAAGGTLIGGAGNDVLTGAATNDTLIGGDGNDVLNGGGGADLMMGGLGNDTYTVDDVGDVVVENAGEGTDTVKTSLAS